MGRKNFQVAIMHGHSEDYLEVKKYVQECKFTPRLLIEEYSADTIFANLRDLIWDEIHCVIVVLTKDDEMLNGNKRARQNVIFELGYCIGVFETLNKKGPYKPKNAIIVIAEENVELFENINGLTRIVYESGKIHEKKEFIMASLAESHKKAKEYYTGDFL